ncbi:casein kinase, putative [Entamoeba invadens IP1]|uniref:Casein kinase, putative n=1 Tax=Entamoeba invadens IP1 TaxID=370355 RepID=A0A0A1U0N6_ENTIV|nr:casein kinase, putative [Entamoeba invadens IP1]ELP87465.1 casein kinase, putative [Entamoeba invadens IP1]|eukprot:XP_004254236.1 casein kinase, putative [Entamoeba invadens IP1]
MAKVMFIISNKYRLDQKLGSGSFGDVYRGVDISNNQTVAVKLEVETCKHPQLEFEYELYKLLTSGEKTQPEGLPAIKYFGLEGEFRVLVMDYLGPSLEDLFNYCGRKFTLKTVLMLMDQCLRRIEFVHKKGWIHRDIKPDNFIMGTGDKSNVCYLIDFGLSNKYITPEGEHIPYNENRSLTGTARYASLNNHLGHEQSRRDDLESFAYSILYLAKGSLPWQGLKVQKGEDRYTKIYNKKVATPIPELCAGLPKEFASFLSYCKSLKYDEAPDYTFWRHIFEQCGRDNKIEYDDEYDWIIKRRQEKVDE